MVLEDRRYLILRALHSANGYQASSSLLQAFLDSFGQKVSTDLLDGDLSWLEEQGLILTSKEIGADIKTAMLKPRGSDIAAGRASYPGVRKPRVGEI